MMKHQPNLNIKFQSESAYAHVDQSWNEENKFAIHTKHVLLICCRWLINACHASSAWFSCTAVYACSVAPGLVFQVPGSAWTSQTGPGNLNSCESSLSRFKFQVRFTEQREERRAQVGALQGLKAMLLVPGPVCWSRKTYLPLRIAGPTP